MKKKLREKLKEYGFNDMQVLELLTRGWIRCDHGHYELRGNILKLTREDKTTKTIIL